METLQILWSLLNWPQIFNSLRQSEIIGQSKSVCAEWGMQSIWLFTLSLNH